MMNLLKRPTRLSPLTPNWESLLPPGREALLQGLGRQGHDFLCAADQNLDQLEERLWRSDHELFRPMREQAAQQKADGGAGVGGPLLDQLQANARGKVITELEQRRNKVGGAARERIERVTACLQTHHERLDYGTAKQKGELLTKP